MLIGLARGLTAMAKATGLRRVLGLARLARAAASWLRGGDWSLKTGAGLDDDYGERLMNEGLSASAEGKGRI